MQNVAEVVRILLDESSFDFRHLPAEDIERHLDELSDTIMELRARGGHHIARAPMWDAIECLDGCELWQFLCRAHSSDVDRDTLVRSHTLIERCVEWEAADDAEVTVSIDGAEPQMALSIAYAHGMALIGRGLACLVFPGNARMGFLPVSTNRGETVIFFFRNIDEIPVFWRHLFAFENVTEGTFFDLAALAFPGLLLHPGLSFGRFDGAYRDLRDPVVAILAVISDHFAVEYGRCRGVARDIRAVMGPRQVDISPESPSTRASQQLMRLRDVALNGGVFRCEWHAKVEPHRNRIHFALPTPLLPDKILIGLFVDHLPT